MSLQQEGAFLVRLVAVIGAGPAGRAFAFRCAAAGLQVTLEDVMPSNLRRAQDEYADQSAGTALRYASTVEEAVQSADLAIDFVPDELESKLEIFSLLDRMAPPRTVLCTPTRALSITDLASCTYRAGRCIALRSTGPDLLKNDVIEIVRSRFVEAAVLNSAMEFFTRLRLASRIIEDSEAPMLMKNIAQ